MIARSKSAEEWEGQLSGKRLFAQVMDVRGTGIFVTFSPDPGADLRFSLISIHGIGVPSASNTRLIFKPGIPKMCLPPLRFQAIPAGSQTTLAFAYNSPLRRVMFGLSAIPTRTVKARFRRDLKRGLPVVANSVSAP